MRPALLVTLTLLPAAIAAQAPAAPTAARLGALTAEQQVAAAVLPLPAEFRAAARVLGHAPGTAGWTELRPGTGPFVCLAPEPGAERFHAACYHRSMEAFMARGRALRAGGTTGDRVDSVRFAEVRAKRLRMPTQPAALYSLTGPADGYDAATNVAARARPLFVIYTPFATEASTGLSTKPAEGTPWIMFPGTPKAHIMLVPRM